MPALARVATEGAPFRSLVRMVLPSVTLVTPAGPDVRALERTVASVSRQDYAGYQHVIVDRGLSPEVRDRAQAADEAGRVTIVDALGADEFEALREGIDAAIGEFVAYLPAGSVLLPAALKHLARQLVERPSIKVVVFDELAQRGRERVVVRRHGRVGFRELLAGEEIRPECVVFRRSTYGRVHGLDGVAGRLGAGGLRHAAFLDLLLRLSKRARFARGEGHFGVRWESVCDAANTDAARQEREGVRRHASARLRTGQRARLALWRLRDALAREAPGLVEPAHGAHARPPGRNAEPSTDEWAGEPRILCPLDGTAPAWFVGTLANEARGHADLAMHTEAPTWVYRAASTLIFAPSERGGVLASGPADGRWCEGFEPVIVPAVSRVARLALARDAAGKGVELASPGLARVGDGLAQAGWRTLGRAGEGVGGASLVLTGDALTRTEDVGPELARLFARAARGGVVVAFAPNADCDAARRGSWLGLRAGALGRRWLGTLEGWRKAAALAGLEVRAACEVPAFDDARGLIVVAIGAGKGVAP
ncbi:MAG: hypothetical protein SFY95_07365 [Planctomycetota bacterium]|nr:hypothetical protein [Planctomycetota bacterium]